mmetsp:Transcript_3892/g.4016  ORF Transcript_3892/g.4016 Transcript_3892/m.4016 type:complete len:162 (+) Transcript_3892:2-487(+)
MIDLWEMRNEEVQGKDERAKQQKRKDKAAIAVWALHKLQKQARPSDSFLFYSDVEAEIENATSAKLEAFIAMKTRLIHNSIRKWVKRSTSEVKSIVEWIRIRGKNNKEAIERIEKRLRDHFRHEAHKKTPKKKTKGRDSTVYSTMRQTALSGFISVKNNLY